MIKIICAIIYNEHTELEEWIRHNLSIGFDHIYLFEDYGSKTHSSITDQFANVTLSTLEVYDINNSGSPNKQKNLYDKFLKQHQEDQDVDWIAFIDVDEFIMLEDGYTLESMLEEFKDEAAVFLCWKNYSASGHLEKKPEGMTNLEYYDKEVSIWVLHTDIQYMLKSIINVNKDNKIIHVHLAEDGVFTNHKKYKNPGMCCYDKAWINHYFYKSWEDWCYRMLSRGNMGSNVRTFDTWFEGNPEFKDKEKQMINDVRKQHMRTTYIISNKYKLINGGNKQVIQNIQSNLKNGYTNNN